jgi:cyclic dehypoxanthinyl futalosine synthase
MDSLPGGGAEILDDDIRTRISPFKNTADEWLPSCARPTPSA